MITNKNHKRTMKIVPLIFFSMLFTAMICETGFSKTNYFIPKIEPQSDSISNSNSDFQIYLWNMQNSSPKMFTSYVKIIVNDSILLDMQNPQFLSNEGMITFDALDIWRMTDTMVKKINILNISGFTKENAQNAKISLEAGVYLIQLIYFFEFHPKIKLKDKLPVVSFGQIQFGDETISLDKIQFIKSSAKKLEHAKPPDGSLIR